MANPKPVTRNNNMNNRLACVIQSPFLPANNDSKKVRNWTRFSFVNMKKYLFTKRKLEFWPVYKFGRQITKILLIEYFMFLSRITTRTIKPSIDRNSSRIIIPSKIPDLWESSRQQFMIWFAVKYRGKRPDIDSAAL